MQQQAGTLWRCWQQTAARRPRASLLTDATTGRTYRADEVTQAAEVILADNNFVPTGSGVAWALPNGLDWLAIFLAAQKAGVAALPLDPSLDQRQGRKLAQRLGATHWWDGQTSSRLPPTRKKWRQAAVVKVTSGSTGKPVAIPCSAQSLLADCAHICKGMGIGTPDKNLGLIPFGHSYGLGNLVLPLIAKGVPIISAGDYTIAQIHEWCERFGPTVFPSVPAVFKLLAESVGSNQLGRLRLAISAGAPLPAEVAQVFARRFGRRIHNFYGASETGGICYDRTGHASLAGRGVGHPLPGVRVSVRNNRVVVRSPAVAASHNKFMLADCGQWNDRHELVLTGRIGQLANISGRKVTPVEIESALRTLPGVTDAWCGIGSQAGRHFLAVAVETQKPTAELTCELRRHLPDWKMPRRWLTLAEFPHTLRGKTDVPTLAKKLGL